MEDKFCDEKIINLPNSLSFFRIILIAPTIYLLLNEFYKQAFFVLFIASITDFLDGFLARKLNQTTLIGKLLDPLADKILINYAFLLFTIKGAIPQFLWVTVFFKDTVLIVGSLVILTYNKEHVIKSSYAGKLATFFQIVLLLYILFEKLNILHNNLALSVIVYITFAFSIFALLHYVKKALYLIKT
ncbi:MAG: CDP-alcohol phosphatidyltransferase family protein [Desulfurella sp.]|uniref:CDP-diacylglycerol--glycerol-3-phosphate 3-phosphatidyltransferase n=1 Tax=Desulfurella multipotens TaxID=79269 RepID=A0A1G6PF31_9BACT|nr:MULTISPECIES: CDP-alcohol phosphatidyltransferase family protein [Desulfurella]SDC77955.1 CDP-diacylglycerol--glycerol-3-phosphate 3-phosphatidyltransferase [Desulfurella multipotens]